VGASAEPRATLRRYQPGPHPWVYTRRKSMLKITASCNNRRMPASFMGRMNLGSDLKAIMNLRTTGFCVFAEAGTSVAIDPALLNPVMPDAKIFFRNSGRPTRRCSSDVYLRKCRPATQASSASAIRPCGESALDVAGASVLPQPAVTCPYDFPPQPNLAKNRSDIRRISRGIGPY
jgi:hypothetical protein